MRKSRVLVVKNLGITLFLYTTRVVVILDLRINRRFIPLSKHSLCELLSTPKRAPLLCKEILIHGLHTPYKSYYYSNNIGVLV